MQARAAITVYRTHIRTIEMDPTQVSILYILFVYITIFIFAQLALYKPGNIYMQDMSTTCTLPV